MHMLMQQLCLQSRQSILTGIRPQKFKFKELFREECPNCVTLPEYFRKKGYHTESLSKTFHPEDEESWSIPVWHPRTKNYFYPEYHTKINVNHQIDLFRTGNAQYNNDLWRTCCQGHFNASIWEAPDLPDGQFYDNRTTHVAIKALERLKDEKFFPAVGFLKPHLPFISPKKYYDLYPKNVIKVPVNDKLPVNAPKISADAHFEWQSYWNTVQNGLPDYSTRIDYLRSYYASVSFVDAQIGALLRALDKLKLSDKTIVVLIGDHGYHLFENGILGKHTNFDLALKVPFIIKYPNKIKKGTRVDSIVELVDLFPTLCDYAGFKGPFGIDGRSLRKLINNSKARWKNYAISFYKRNDYLGSSIRTNKYRYTEWNPVDKNNAEVIKELYEYKNNNDIEIENLASNPEKQDMLNKLANRLHKLVGN